MKKPTIEVGDKVRIVRMGDVGEEKWGAPGEVGTVIGSAMGHPRVEGVGDPPHRWFHPVVNLALFADELEDMPEGTVVTRCFAGDPHFYASFSNRDGTVFATGIPVTDSEILRIAKAGAK